MTIEEAFEKLQKIKEARAVLDEKEVLAKGIILDHMKKKKLDKLIGESATASMVTRTSYEVSNESVIPDTIEVKKSVSAIEVKKWQDSHATIAIPPGLVTKTSEPSLTVRFGKE